METITSVVDNQGQIGKMEKRLKHWGAKLDDLSARAGVAQAAGINSYNKGLDELKGKYAAARAQFDALKTAGEEKWEMLKGDLERTTRDFETAFKNLTSKD